MTKTIGTNVNIVENEPSANAATAQMMAIMAAKSADTTRAAAMKGAAAALLSFVKTDNCFGGPV